MALELVVPQGATFIRRFQWRTANPSDPTQPGPPVDLTGWHGRLQARAKKRPDSELLVDLTEPNQISIDGPNGVVTVTIPAAMSANFGWKHAAWDLLLWSTTEDVRLVEGTFVLSPQVTVR
jgi:hypothetical protein